MRGSRMALAAVCLGVLYGAPALAGEWVAVKLHGKVFEFVDGTWEPLERGDIVPDDRPIRTLRSGRVTFVKGDQTIDFGAETAAQIIDSASGQKTTVFEHFGVIAIEADVRTTEHFAVETKFLAAVVKGTKFVVTSDDTHSTVEVTRGQVKVDDVDHSSTVMVAVGEIATVSAEAPADVVVASAHSGIVKKVSESADVTPSVVQNPKGSPDAADAVAGSSLAASPASGFETVSEAPDDEPANDGADADTHNSGQGHKDDHDDKPGKGDDGKDGDQGGDKDRGDPGKKDRDDKGDHQGKGKKHD